jgi:microcystin-dependent protein
MGTPFLGEIKIISWNFAPQGWAFCNGQLLPINQNQPLFSLFGTMYGGDGRVNFALPNLRGAYPMHMGNGHVEGERSGQASHTVTINEMPLHNHVASASPSPGDVPIPTGNVLASPLNLSYRAPDGLVPLEGSTLSGLGGSQAHENRQPYLALNFIVALQGVFPSRN